MEKLLPLIRDLYELHNLRKTTVTSNLTTAITTVIVLRRWLYHRSQCACSRRRRRRPNECNYFYFSARLVYVFIAHFYYYCVCAHFFVCALCRCVRLSSLQVSLICITANRLFFAHLLNDFGIRQCVRLCLSAHLSTPITNKRTAASRCEPVAIEFILYGIYSKKTPANRRQQRQQQYWSSHRKPQNHFFSLLMLFCSFALARCTREHFQTRKTKLATHSCFNFNIYIYDPIKIVTLDLHLR